MQFQNKAAISTGAASGMGLLFAQCWAAEGGNVLMCDVNEVVLQAESAAINAQGQGKALPNVCDVRDYDQVSAACDKAVAGFSTIDIVVNFAGGNSARIHKIPKEQEFPDIPISVFDWGLDVNLKGPFYFAHAAMKHMRRQNSGLIVNIGSITGAEGTSKGMDYAASKAALMYGLTKSLAQYGGQYGIPHDPVAGLQDHALHNR
jgi:NAD(P)-dependent dehydrogenase (short-subunit alcohol dehydrogenase family)